MAAVSSSKSASTESIELVVICSGAFYAVLQELAPMYEKKTGKKVTLISGSSRGSSPTAIPARLKKGEKADILIMGKADLDLMTKDGFVVPGSQTDFVLSKTGMAVRAGAPKPDISTTDAFIKTLLNAKSIGYSASVSGEYLVNELFPKLGVWDKIKDKTTKIVTDRVGTVIARGDLEIGFQQVGELLPIPGIDFIGVLPKEIELVSIFSIGFAKASQQAEEARKFVQFLRSSEAHPAIKKLGLEPAP